MTSKHGGRRSRAGLPLDRVLAWCYAWLEAVANARMARASLVGRQADPTT